MGLPRYEPRECRQQEGLLMHLYYLLTPTLKNVSLATFQWVGYGELP